jgi:hypothetical protein
MGGENIMKKALAVILLIATVFALSSCTLVIDLIATGVNSIGKSMSPPVYESAEVEVKFDKLTISVPEGFGEGISDEDFSMYCLIFEAPDGTQLYIEKYDFEELDSGAGLLLTEYAEELRSSLLEDSWYRDVGEVTVEDGLTYVKYSTNQLISYTLFASFYMNGESVYVVTFGREGSSYDVYEPYFKTWARSVKISAAGTEI